MASESERCVDELLIRQAKLDEFASILKDENYDTQIGHARELVSSTQVYIDNNKSIIPSYCLKKVSDSLRKLEVQINEPQKSKLQFKFKSMSHKTPAPDQQLLSAKLTDEVLKINKEGEKETKSEECTILPEFFGAKDRRDDKKIEFLPHEVEGKDVSLINLEKCTVSIIGQSSTVYIRNLKSCQVTICLASRAITITNCANCQFKVICQQLRIDSCNSCDFEIFTSARSMLESSTGLNFKAIQFSSLINHLSEEDIGCMFTKAKFNISQNNWNCIDDFDWLSPNVPSKNYTLDGG